jgi:hypothetical protein
VIRSPRRKIVMKTAILMVASFLGSVSGFGQGAVVFSNRVVGPLTAQVTLEGTTQGLTDGVGGPGVKWEAQLFGGPEGGPLIALVPKTTFRTGGAAGFVVPVDVIVPNVAPSSKASMQMRVFTTDGLGSGASMVFTVILGGGLFPPASLIGLEAFSASIVPEPSSIALGVIGAAGLFVVSRAKR